MCYDCKNGTHERCVDIHCDCCYGNFLDDKWELMFEAPCPKCGGYRLTGMVLCDECNDSESIMYDDGGADWLDKNYEERYT